MTLFARLTAALILASAAGGTALAVLYSGVLPYGTAGLVISALLLMGTAGLARWVIRPLQNDLRRGGSGRNDIDQSHVADDPWAEAALHGNQAWDELMARLHHYGYGPGTPGDTRPGLPANPLLACLFQAASTDVASHSHEAFVSRLFSDWINDGTLRAVALAQGARHTVSFLAHCPPGLRPLHQEDIPPEIRKLPATAPQPKVVTTDTAVWAAFPTGPAPAHPGDHTNSAPRNLMVAWPEDHRVELQELIALATVARYIGARGHIAAAMSRPQTHSVPPAADLQAHLFAYLGLRLHDLVREVEEFCNAVHRAAQGDSASLPASLDAQGRRLRERLTDLLHGADGGWLPAPGTHCPVFLPSLIEQVLLPYRNEMERGHITLRCDTRGAGKPVTTDPVALSAIMDALISNAVRFTPDHGRIVLRVTRLDDGRQGELVVAVRDSGVGLSPDSAGHLGEAFFQGPEAARRMGSGHGLGLALATRLAERLNGSLNGAGNDTGNRKGSTFVLRIPLHPVTSPNRETLVKAA
ncbi:MAG: ATP-binding protein [Nitrospirota bacterium]|nr:ATP-binding protein [Nitrospirota bacterium]